MIGTPSSLQPCPAGAVFTDSLGRHSKRLQLPGTTGHVVVRKMVCHNGLAYGKDKAKDRGSKTVGGDRSKKKGQRNGRKSDVGQKRAAGQLAAGRVAKKKQKKQKAAKA